MLGATTSFPGPLNSHNTATLAAVRRHLAQLNFAGAATFDALGVPLLGGEFQLCKDLSFYVRRVAEPTPLNTLLMLFVLDQPVTRARAERAMAPVGLSAFVDAGLVREADGEVRAAVRLSGFNGLLLAHDRYDGGRRGLAEDHVLGVNPTTITMSALTVRRRAARALDVEYATSLRRGSWPCGSVDALRFSRFPPGDATRGMGRKMRATMRVATEVPAFVLVTLCAACSSAPSPTSPTPSRDASRLIPVADYSGAWHGVYTITECTGQRHCFQVRGRQMPFVLRLSQAGHAVEGVLHVDGFSVPVTGMAAPAGDLNVTGHLASPGPRSAAVDVTRFAARRHDQGFEAELVFTKTYPPTATESQTVYGPVQHTGGRIESASRGALTPLESFEGVWFGRAVIRECLVVSGPTCSLGPSEERDFKLSLQQNGTHVSGSLTFPQLGEVTGTVTGNTLELERAAIETPGGSQRSVLHLERWTGRRDAAGLLTGSFEYVEEMLWLLTPPRENYVTRYLADVVSGVLLP